MNILTFDIEEWFHLLDIPSLEDLTTWVNYEPRIEQNLDRILDFLVNNELSATFFCLGWVGKKYPKLVKKIDKLGFEIGSHSTNHTLSYTLTPDEFEKDITDSVKILSDITGKKVKYFRAPGFSITNRNLWAFEILYDIGIEIDCSVFPTKRAHGGLPVNFYPEPSLVEYNGKIIKELPISVNSFFNFDFVFSGGGYFRLIPYYLLKRWSQDSNYIMAYFHPRDFDPSQPILKNLSLLRKFKSYYGLKRSFKKFNKWTNDFSFIDVKEANEKISWDSVKIVKI